MSVLKNKLKQVQDNKSLIDQKVENTPVNINNDESALVDKITAAVSEKHKDTIAKDGLTDEVKQDIFETISEETDKFTSDYEQKKRIERIAKDNIAGLGPIESFMKDNTITEIIVQRYNNICIERNGLIESVSASFNNEEHLRTVINRIVQPVGRQINLTTPIVDARLPDGSRVNATIPPVSPDGALLTIRKFSDKALTGKDYLNFGSLSVEMLAFLKKCVEGKICLIVSGGTSTGKTTLLNMLSQFIPKNELIVTIEDSCELRLQQPNVRRLEARQINSEGAMKMNIQTLVKNALRMRPDRIIVGEIRDGTIVDMMSAMSTGHEGSMSTVHANSPEALINSRMPVLYSMYDGADFSENAQARQISEALQLIVQINRLKDGSRKITRITHVVGLKGNSSVKLKDIFVYDEEHNKFCATGYVPQYLINQCKLKGIDIPEKLFEVKDKTEVHK